MKWANKEEYLIRSYSCLKGTNNVEALDKALFRRFDDSIEYLLPKSDEVIKLLKETLCNNLDSIDIYSLSDTFAGMSHAEIKIICSDVMKESILDDCPITNQMIHNAIIQRRSAYQMIG